MKKNKKKNKKMKNFLNEKKLKKNIKDSSNSVYFPVVRVGQRQTIY